MDFGYRFKDLENRSKELAGDIVVAKEAFERAKDFTTKLLSECEKVKVKVVAIGISDARVPSSKTFPFGVSGNVFAMGKDPSSCWPAIWGACERAGLESSCGNSDQRQLKDDSQVIDGLYMLSNGKWSKVK
jgi:hypothetical protein